VVVVVVVGVVVVVVVVVEEDHNCDQLTMIQLLICLKLNIQEYSYI
jgi:hypothetical protein